MSLYKTKGIVLKTFKLGEADRIVTFLTPSHGQVRAVAKGIRKTKSKFGSRLEPFSHGELLIYAGRHALDIVTQVELIDSFQDIRDDFDRLTHGSGMLDLVEKVSLEGDADPSLFTLLLRGLEAVAKADRRHSVLLSAFDLKLMSVAGYYPKLDACAICGDSGASLVRFSNERGGAICERCFGYSGLGAPLGAEILRLMAKLLRTKLIDLVDLEVDPGLESELGRAVGEFVAYHLQARLKSRECLTQIACLERVDRV